LCATRYPRRASGKQRDPGPRVIHKALPWFFERSEYSHASTAPGMSQTATTSVLTEKTITYGTVNCLLGKHRLRTVAGKSLATKNASVQRDAVMRHDNSHEPSALQPSCGAGPVRGNTIHFREGGSVRDHPGTNLTGASSVIFDGTPATFKVISKSEIKTTVPDSATSGTVKVTTPSRKLSSNVPFQVTK
jgi:hypothetical protein